MNQTEKLALAAGIVFVVVPALVKKNVLEGVVGYVRPEDRIRYLGEHKDEFMKHFPPAKDLRHHDKKLVPEMQNFFLKLLRNGHASRMASNRVIEEYRKRRGRNNQVISAFTLMGIIDRRLGADY